MKFLRKVTSATATISETKLGRSAPRHAPCARACAELDRQVHGLPPHALHTCATCLKDACRECQAGRV